MRRIVFVLFILLMSFGYGKNLDNYKSKRVFDKYIAMLKSGNSRKYLEDRDLQRVMESNSFELDEYSKFLDDTSWVFRDYQYNVIDVKETEDTSILKIKVKYKVYTVSKEEFGKEVDRILFEINNIKNGSRNEQISNLSLDEFSKLYVLLDKKFKDTVIYKDEILSLEMKKADDLWDIESNNLNYRKFHITTHYLDGMIAVVTGLWEDIE